MIVQQLREIVSLRNIYVFMIMFSTVSCYRMSVARCGLETIRTFEKIESYNVRVKVINASTGELLKGASIAISKNGNLKLVYTKTGIETFTIPDKGVVFRTGSVGFYRNDFVIKPDKYNVLEILSYVIPDSRPL